MIEDYYVDCSRLRNILVDNGHGKMTNTYSSMPIRGYVGSASNVQIDSGGKITIETRYNFYCDNYDWKIGDYVEYEGLKYEVVAKQHNTVHRNHHCKLMVKTVDGMKGG